MARHMNDGHVLDEVAAAKRACKSTETTANRRLAAEKIRVRSFFVDSDSDVERAAKHNAIKRAEAAFDETMSAAKIIDRLETLRVRAGEWADLVPVVR